MLAKKNETLRDKPDKQDACAETYKHAERTYMNADTSCVRGLEVNRIQSTRNKHLHRLTYSFNAAPTKTSARSSQTQTGSFPMCAKRHRPED